MDSYRTMKERKGTKWIGTGKRKEGKERNQEWKQRKK